MSDREGRVKEEIGIVGEKTAKVGPCSDRVPGPLMALKLRCEKSPAM